ncbi:unnamed protein product [Adineta steineri]|uniref:Rho-GAP domain-containing protein n=1 Tax=Adineta steineri TaxID=433720 RepID=A0A813WT41_9BILA|nr:unnamed protein product [Adineta steineri]CAF0865749.1 unnamed protein product [Adineta steineri]
MATPPNVPLSSKSRGHSLFDRQAQLHAHDPEKPLNATISDIPIPLPTLKAAHSVSSASTSTSSTTFHHQHYSPPEKHRRLPLTSTESYAHTNDNTVQLLSVHPRPESDYIKEVPSPSLSALVPPTAPSKLLETDFPLYENVTPVESEKVTSENVIPNDTSSVTIVEQAFDYLTSHDDDDDVIHEETNIEQDDYSYSFDDEDEDHSIITNDLDATTGIHIHQNDSAASHTLSSTEINDNTQQIKMAYANQGTISEEYDSDFDNSSHEDDEQIPHKDSINEYDEEQQNQIILRQQQLLWGIVQEWLRKEELYCEQLKTMAEQFNQVAIPSNLHKLIEQLIVQHKRVYQEIEDLHDCDHQFEKLTNQLTHTVETLMETLPVYTEYIKMNLAPIRKLLDKRSNVNGLSSEDLLSIPPKQFLQILSQVQDLYQTSQSFESDDKNSMHSLYNHAQKCKAYGSQQDENINKVILKNEDVVTMSAREKRDRCRLILYPDAIVCCNLKPKLLTSPKYTLLWYISMLDLHWTIPENSDDNVVTGDELKMNLKSNYRELEKTQKTNATITTRLSKNIRRQESEFHLAQSKLQLILSNSCRSSAPPSIILFSSAYQRQDWIDLIDKTKQDLIQRSSANLNQANHPQRLNDSIIQKRLDFIKPNSHETNLNELPSTIQTATPSKTYSGTLCITIHSIHGTALYNPIRQYQTLPLMSSPQQQMEKNFQFYVAVEIDSYNTFYPYAKTAKQIMQQQDTVEFKGEVFNVELEYSLAFRFLIYRIDTSPTSRTNSLQRPVCIGKFHRDIDTALRDCQRSPSGVIYLESQSGDLKLKMSLKYSKRDGTFRRQASKRSLAVFGKSIEKLTSTSNGLIDGIPRIIVKCINVVECDGLNETGIYRVCCVASDLQKLRHEFDRDSQRAEGILAQKNVHVAANLLKLFFRELPDPLFSSILYKDFLQAIQLTDMDYQRVTLLKLIDSLHSDNRKILFYLLDHLIRVSEYSHINMMHLDNLAVVFGPTLMRPSKLIITTIYSDNNNQRLNNNNGQVKQTDIDQMSTELQGSMYQCQVVLACLKLRRDKILI